MPTYEYECKECKHNFETFQAMSDEPLKECPKCGGEIKRLIFGGAGIIFKGSGFYVTDKDKGAAMSKKAASKPGGTDTGSVSSGSTDAAPASGPDAPSKSDAKVESSNKPAKDAGASKEVKASAKSA